MTRQEKRFAIERIVELAISDGEWIGYHRRDMKPSDAIDVQALCRKKRIAQILAIIDAQESPDAT